jgi:putative two-component system response regulator
MDRHDTLLITSASAENRTHLRHVMEEGFNLLEAVNVHQTLLLLEQNASCVAALLVDITCISDADKQLLLAQETQARIRSVPIIIFTQDDDTERLNRAFNLGAADVIALHYEPYAMLHRIENIVQLHLHKQNLETMVQEQAAELRQAGNAMVEALSSIIEYRSVESGQHILRIRHFTKILLEEVVRCCPEYAMTEEDISIICSAAALHDVGKIAIPDSVLLKPGKLTAEEMELMKTHTVTGCGILDTLVDVAEEKYLRYAHNICHYHHERWDGSGYPEGLAGEAIPICAQVVGLADAYDALTTKRVYKDAVTCAQAANMIMKGECGVFSPKLLECFKHVTHLYEELARNYADGLSPKAESFDATLETPAALQDQDTMERTRSKYFALVHYLNGFLMELNMDMELFHIVYNPFPELAGFQGISTFRELQELILNQLTHPSDRERMKELIEHGISKFLHEGLRRLSDVYRLCSKNDPEGELYEVTFLRINSVQSDRRSLAVLVRKQQVQEISDGNSRFMPVADAVLRCRNDRNFTLVDVYADTDLLADIAVGDGLLRLVHPEDRDMVRRQFDAQFRNGTDAKVEFRQLEPDGTVRWLLNQCRLTVDADGEEYLYCAVTDISDFRATHVQLTEKLERYEIILAQTENVLFEWDAKSDQIEFSNTWKRIFGYEPIRSDLRGQLAVGTLLHPDDLPLLYDSISNIENGSDYEMVEVRIATDKGRYLWCRVRATAIRDKKGALEKISGIIINIDAEKQAERALKDRAERDSLTKLLNKDAGRKQSEEYFSRYPDGVQSALLIIDLDDFKKVNDQYGHLFGDAVLTQTAREIKKLFRNQDIVSRIGGDEFLVLMRGVSDRNLVENRSQQLLNVLQTIFRQHKHKLPMSCSIGIAISPEHGKSYYELFNRADRALYRAKAMGKNNYVIYDEEEEQRSLRMSVGSAVNNRIDSDEEPGLADDNLVRYAFQRLYGSKNVQKSVNEILELVGRKMNVSRVYVFENSDDNRYCSNTFEWCNEGIEPEIHNLQHISYEEDLAGYVDMYNEQGIFYCPDIDELPKNIYDIVAPQGIKSLLHCAIRDGGMFRGYIGFDECVELRYWTKEQIQTLSYFSEMLSIFLLKQRKQEKSQAYAVELQSILDNQNAWIYIIDPDTYRLKYLNAKTRLLAPDVKPGMCCYSALMGQDKRCEGCPSVNIRSKKNDNCLMHNSRFDLDVLAEATLIQWSGEESCLLTCREIPKEK